MNENNKVIMISLELPVKLNTQIREALIKMGGLSRSAFIRQALQEKLSRIEE